MPKRAMASASRPRSAQIAARGLAFGVAFELAREKCRGFAMHLHQRGALLLFAALLGRALARARHGDAALFRDGAHRVQEVALVHLHHELENVAADAAAEAVIDLLHRMHRERRRFLGVERAEAGEILAALFQAHVFADHADDVRLLLDAIGE